MKICCHAAAQNQAQRIGLILAVAPNSGDLMDAVRCSSFGTRHNNTSPLIAISLPFGDVVQSLACRKYTGCHMRHNAVNDLNKPVLASSP